MARPRKPTRVLELNAAFTKNPKRMRTREPQPNLEFNPASPDHLSEQQKKCWKEIVEIVPHGVLGNADGICVEIVACLLSEFRDDPVAMPASRLTRLSTELGKLGLNPAARASLSIPQPKRKNPFDDD